VVIIFFICLLELAATYVFGTGFQQI